MPILRWAGGGGGELDKRRLLAGSFTVIVLYLRSLLKVCAWQGSTHQLDEHHSSCMILMTGIVKSFYYFGGLRGLLQNSDKSQTNN